jgi:hypothetical protein
MSSATKRKRIAAELDLLGEAAVAYSLASRKFGGGDALAYDVEMYARLELSRASHAYADALLEANARNYKKTLKGALASP